MDFEQILAEYRVSLSQQHARLTELRARLDDPEALAEVRTIAHRLHGSGAAYGLAQVTAAGQAVEHADSAGLPEALAGLLEVLSAEGASPD